MKDLFLSECRRFKNAALIFFGAHLVLQFVANRFVELLQREWQVHTLLLVLYMLAGLGFAVYQFGSYRQPSRWMWLMHRPLSPLAIFAATGMASATLITFAVGLPALLAVLGTDLLTGRTVDVRHYLLVLQLLVLTISAWLTGSYVILNRSRSAIVIILLPFLLLLHLASGWVLLLPYVLCLALLVLIVRGAFKPNRMAPPSTGTAIAATALPLQLGFYFLLIWGGSLVYQYGQMLLNVHPLNRPVPVAGTFVENTRAESPEVMLRGLAGASDPRAAQWRRQLPLLKLANFESDILQYPVRNQTTNAESMMWTDEKRNIIWTFSHDAMRYHGQDAFTGQSRGWLGLGGMGDGTPFPAVPLQTAQVYLMMPQQLSLFDKENGKIRPLLRLSAPEVLVRTPVEVGDLAYVITNRRLIAFNRQEVGATGLLEERFSMPLPGPLSDLDRIDIATLLDGRLVSFSFGRSANDGDRTAPQSVHFVDATGKSELIASRALEHDFPALFEHHDWWVSPVLYTVLAVPDALLDKGLVLDQGATRNTRPLLRSRPMHVWLAAGGVALLSALLAGLWLRRTATSPRRRIGWIASCLLLGPPSLLTLMVLQPRLPREQTAPDAALSAA